VTIIIIILTKKKLNYHTVAGIANKKTVLEHPNGVHRSYDIIRTRDKFVFYFAYVHVQFGVPLFFGRI